MQDGKSAIVNSKINVDNELYAKYLIKNGFCEQCNDTEIDNENKPASQRTNNTVRGKRKPKNP